MRIRVILTIGLLVLAAGCGVQSPTLSSAADAVAQEDGGYMGSGDRQ
jgi:hypothetical protein